MAKDRPTQPLPGGHSPLGVLARFTTRRTGLGAIEIANGRPRAGSFSARAMALWVSRCIGRIQDWWNRRRAERALYALDDRALRDIGVARSDIPSIADGSYFRDSSRRQRGRGAPDAQSKTRGRMGG